MKRHLEYFQKLGQINKELPEKGMQIDTYTQFPYSPIGLDARWNQRIDTEPPMQSRVMGRYKLSEAYTPSHFEGSLAVKALARLRGQRRKEGRAWFLTASFHNPHPPFVPAWKHLQRYWNNRTQLLLPMTLYDDMDNSAYQRKVSDFLRDVNPFRVQEWTALYYALIEEVDGYVGQLLETLGEDVSTTLVIFTSDHGEMLGSHGMNEKNNFYEEASRVPLLISYPGVIPTNTRVKDHVGHIDLVATILDFVGAPEMDHSDGSSLRPMLQLDTHRINQNFDQTATFAEWDFRKPNIQDLTELDRRIDDRPSFMVRKGPYKLMMQKLHESDELDMMFNLEEDLFERQNLLGKNSMDASTNIIAKAEHMRCLLLDWMERLDGGVSGEEAYYSNPANNYNDGKGDINEILFRQKWRRIGLWTSAQIDDPLVFGAVSWTGSEFIRHEWVYVGTRQEKSYTVVSASITGKDRVFFRIDEETIVGKTLEKNSCESIRVTFRANVWSPTGVLDASLLLSLSQKDSNAQESRRIPLILGDLDFETRRTLQASNNIT
jgi:arylsulfatase A-like enzyme